MFLHFKHLEMTEIFCLDSSNFHVATCLIVRYPTSSQRLISGWNKGVLENYLFHIEDKLGLRTGFNLSVARRVFRDEGTD